MPLSSLPLSYCTNVHPGRSVSEVEAGLDRYTVPVARTLGGPLAAGLWLAKPVVDELQSAPDGVRRFADALAQRGLTCHTLNAFPFGDFHSTRVKEKVYLPDWSSRDRLNFTVQCATILAELLPPDVEGSISTLPLGFKGFVQPPDFQQQCATTLVAAAVALADLRRRTGRTIRLAVEPEPFCVLETTPEAIAFFRLLRQEADRLGSEDVVREHIGLCYDVCHQAVEYENIAESIGQFRSAEIRLNKVHLSCALQLNDPATNAAGRAELKRYVEERYLHQTMASLPCGKVARFVDLCDELIDHPDSDFLAAPSWRVHFHVPVDADELGPLATTRPQLKEAIAAVDQLDYAPHLEVETYTWQVLPGQAKPDLVTGLSRELSATAALLARG